MNNLFTLSEQEKNRIRGLHLTESKDKRLTSVLCEQKSVSVPSNCVMVSFGRGESQIDTEIDRNIVELLDKGMMRDRPFITIEAGTSGTGSDAANREVMDDRINEAILLVIKAAKNLVGPRGLNYAESAIQSKIDRQYSYNTIEPGSVIGDEQVPTDEDDPFFNQFQYVKICFNEVLETPEYDSIADEFVEATIDTTFGYDEGTVYSILTKLRDKDDFDEFNAELKRGKLKMDFYEISCDKLSADLTPGWMDKILGTSGEVTLATEIGPSDTTINAHLQRLGVPPINC
jgi:hypothetical protein|tara:strand:+ start:2805 stop:3668 length:864 start_codon:yes stop_codon:yes gene_type:complete